MYPHSRPSLRGGILRRLSLRDFGRIVVQGGLTTGLLLALVAMDMPGPGTVFLSRNWKFTAPVYVGDTITAHAEVVHVHPRKPVTELSVRVPRDPGGQTVLEGEAWCNTFTPVRAPATAGGTERV